MWRDIRRQAVLIKNFFKIYITFVRTQLECTDTGYGKNSNGSSKEILEKLQYNAEHVTV